MCDKPYLCTYVLFRHSDFRTGEFPHSRVIIQTDKWCRLSDKLGKGKHFVRRLRTGLGKKLTDSY